MANMLKIENTTLVVVDVQGKLAQLMHEKENLFLNLQRIVQGALLLEIPVLWNEQYPEGLGPTVSQVADLLKEQKPFVKKVFSCCGNEGFSTQLANSGRKQVLLVGIETHVCVYQTAQDLVAEGYEVQVVVDAVSSRTEENKEIGLERMREIGAGLTSVETALFELLRTAEHARFREISKLVK